LLLRLRQVIGFCQGGFIGSIGQLHLSCQHLEQIGLVPASLQALVLDATLG
jgi:hypothetical protein